MNNTQIVETYYRSHRDELLAFVRSRLASYQPSPTLEGRLTGGLEPEDFVQEVFTRLLTTDKLISEVTLPCLAYTMASHLLTDYYRRHHHFENYEHQVRHVPADTDSAEYVVSVRDVTERLERGIARMPKSCREVYRLHVYGGLKVGEISRQLGEGYKSVEHRLGQARRQMRQYMAQMA